MDNRIELLDGQGWIELDDFMGSELKIVNAARIAYNRRSNELNDSDLEILKALLVNGHTSPLEHVVFTFHVYAPIFVVRQWFRHRTWSYSELSRRYSKKDIWFYIPSEFNGDGVKEAGECRELYARQYAEALKTYNELLDKGVKAEQARDVLPVGMMTEFYGTVDLNNLLKFLSLRCDVHAQKEIREYADAIKVLVRKVVPHVAEYLKW